MPSTLITGAEDFSFQTNAGVLLSLNGRMSKWSDSRKYANTKHRIINRDGAKIERQAREPHVFRAETFFIGTSWRDDLRFVVAALDDDPTGSLTHPAYGSFPAFCEGFENAMMDAEAARDMYVLPLTFTEDAIDLKISASSSGIATQQALVTSYSSRLNAATSRYAKAQAAVNTYTGLATQFAGLAAVSGLSKIPDYTLDALLGRVQSSGQTAKRQLSVAAPTQAEAAPAIALVEQVYAACLDLMRARDRDRPQPVEITVPTTMHIAALAQKLYGAHGRDRIDEILTLNPGRIPVPAAIRAGTVLIVSSI